jgi:hypothetical protein
MKEPSSTQVLIACAAVSLLALWSMTNFYSSTEEAAGPNADVYKIGEQAARFEDLAATLPASGLVGFVSDLPHDVLLGAVLYSGARYTLAPRLVTDEIQKTAPEWVVGDFSKPLDSAVFGAQRGLILTKDFGNGVVLYRNRKP